ncbi:GAJ protein [Aspergillus bombycis]|uniref:Meiotic nuclear division protein 1 n=1 Tax=Aspergillus bombycis TaxID=109264 RepID=A0A1F7ZMN5_9EURO|nr:GAJ protein [Aspergillus bombycis]OGM40691.1 GAJ protein [Aspergillus bombycis]
MKEKPPKLTKVEKQARIVSHLRSTGTCHTLKELEKMLPSIVSIRGMQVKEYLHELADEGQIRVEKIGSGNWYWCFSGEEKRELERKVEQLQEEVDRLRSSTEELDRQLAVRKREIEDDEKALGPGERERLIRKNAELQKECQQLRKEWLAVSASMDGGKGIQEMKDEVQEFQREAQMWTDNIYVLEGFMRKMVGAIAR